MSNGLPSSELLAIDVVSDVVCPWCFIGKKRLGKALALRPDVLIELRWRPFQLDPTIPPEGMDRQDYLTRKFGSAARIAEMHAHIAETGAADGISFRFDAIRRAPNTLDAHRLIRWAHAEDVQDMVVDRLFAAYFLEGRDIGDHAVLRDIAEKTGLDGGRIAARLASSEDREAVQEEIATAVRLGVSGVPFYIFGRRYGISGAQSPAVLAAAIDRALAARAEPDAGDRPPA
ncbi:DsbA family oxidoreductase [Chelatococcus sp. SYSU_G07232]|uniref:DsbA family oxidoreductase n=1 Tax=Chelatococcus albus TaxID=3047466 RepID=A0ABT7ACZ9_9HYPH|nr:DsbA family oxidoreductase [Chelatococcus sp. SYSU_G07232]MDJ1156877.1 DsbA family oxidoreductase [Chelatococcus sp. SYSU_G07232]